VEVDGDEIGRLYQDSLPLRRFFCEGNHEAIIRFNDKWRNGAPEVHQFVFALSRSSLFRGGGSFGTKSSAKEYLSRFQMVRGVIPG
jgi:hypothetical protein